MRRALGPALFLWLLPSVASAGANRSADRALMSLVLLCFALPTIGLLLFLRAVVVSIIQARKESGAHPPKVAPRLNSIWGFLATTVAGLLLALIFADHELSGSDDDRALAAEVFPNLAFYTLCILTALRALWLRIFSRSRSGQ